MRTKLTKVNYVIHDRGDTKYSQSENSQNQAAQEGAWVQVSAELVDGLPQGKCQQIVLRNYLTCFYYSINV